MRQGALQERVTNCRLSFVVLSCVVLAFEKSEAGNAVFSLLRDLCVSLDFSFYVAGRKPHCRAIHARAPAVHDAR